MRYTILSLVIIFSLIITCKKPEDKYIIGVKPDAVLRDSSSLTGNAIKKLNYGTPVKILSKGTEKHSILGLEGVWYEISSNELTGFIFGPLVISASSNFYYELANGKLAQKGISQTSNDSHFECLDLTKSNSFESFTAGCLDLNRNKKCDSGDFILNSDKTFSSIVIHPPEITGKWIKMNNRIEMIETKYCQSWCSELIVPDENCISNCEHESPKKWYISFENNITIIKDGSSNRTEFECILK